MNYEIELKAHVYDRTHVTASLNKIGTYLGHTQKSDDYYHFPLAAGISAPDGRNFLSARIREEKTTNGRLITDSFLFTYKKKEVLKNEDGTQIEVNDENESVITDAKAFRTFFEDLGATIDLHKEKSVDGWNVEIDGVTAHAELCEVPPLGDFLEIEIIKEKNDEETVKKMKDIIMKIFEKCGIKKEDIESRYYRDMLKKL
ncbi:MAG: CYTH domain-containing protein [Treponema sp.]|nr:CYTH domain-containing protein [Treponema sp.]